MTKNKQVNGGAIVTIFVYLGWGARIPFDRLRVNFSSVLHYVSSISPRW